MNDMAENEILAQRVIALYSASGKTVATAESCTGGLIAGALTDIAGSSAVVDRGFVTYSNEAKHEMLGVPADLIAQVGAVSEQVARMMAEGALARAGVDRAIAVTGVAGPGGGSSEKPVGLVHFGLAQRDEDTIHAVHIFEGLDRRGVRTATVSTALKMLLASLS